MLASIKSLIKRSVFAIAPQTATAISSARARAHSHNLLREWGLFELNQQLLGEVGCAVLSGPFSGLTLSPMTHREHVGPYLLGIYERELKPWWEELLTEPFAQVIDVGAKFGYYAVGLALCWPDAQVVAYDTDWWARAAMREMMQANQARNLKIKSYCSPDRLRTELVPGAFVISDCEGYEVQLFCSEEIPQLDSATLLIETHDCFVPGAAAALNERFSQSHEISEVGSVADVLVPEMTLKSLTPEQLARVAGEIRPPQSWLLLRPRTRPSG